jgi:hypothetical protein
MKTLLGSLLLFALLGTALAGEPENGEAIIKKDGVLIVSDGSSFYRFEKGGVFKSGPLGMSGRTIEGTWKSDGSYNFTIEGTWSWMNGASAKNDRRRLVLGIEPPFTVDAAATKALAAFAPKGKGPKVMSCYMIIDELVKLPKATK